MMKIIFFMSSLPQKLIFWNQIHAYSGWNILAMANAVIPWPRSNTFWKIRMYIYLHRKHWRRQKGFLFAKSFYGVRIMQDTDHRALVPSYAGQGEKKIG
jgi:hypothetical protein